MALNNIDLHQSCHLIDNEWVKGQGTSFQSYNPSTGKVLWVGSNATPDEVENAFKAAKTALPLWSRESLSVRQAIVEKFADVVEKYSQSLAELISLENGKPLWEAKTEVTSVIGKIKLSIQAYEERCAQRTNHLGDDSLSCLRYKPYGVVAVLGAYNFPAHLSNGHIIPALLAGNTVILKPSELTPAVSQLIMNCWLEAGIPSGVMNCIQGDGQTGQLLLSQPLSGVYFTGSYSTGKKIHQTFADNPSIILALEMGGNNPLIIGDVADMNAAVYQTLLSCFITSGQRCTCARRVYIPNGDFGDKFIKALIQATEAITVGDGMSEKQPFMGPVISKHHAQVSLKGQEHLQSIGGKSLLTMSLLKENSGLLSPGIIDMSKAQRHYDEEIFAPLAQIYRYDTFDEAINAANNTKYGLSAGLLSDSKAQFDYFFDNIKAGIINWNKPTTGAAGNLPFGGIGCSGNHRPSGYFAVDYCAYPIASTQASHLTLPNDLMPGIRISQ
ncbi:succinylglutamate-semialdehyde dehydrogenase [Legionella sp. W05-934-2]|jgi:succinylglutamic semialdehyde dehydrogenase|uniref:succinylglutamate-semialdehyde dehydrogenase n=1 Tax=Legionella sp. W05-934-2 TaxID=1198649 RepID=UPI0034625436